MSEFKEKYLNPFTDYGFKRIFGEEPNKDLLLDFLNELLKDQEGVITSISYLPNEKLPISLGDRRAIFDIYCTSESGEQFIVEMQKAEQKYFKDRTVFYSTFPIQEQARNRNKTWNFELKSVYTIGILDFTFEESDPHKYHHEIKLTDQESKKVFYDKLTYIYLEMPKFNKKINELNTHFDKWMYVLKNLSMLERIPVELQEKIFLKVFDIAELARLTPEEYKQYEASMNAYRDIHNIINTHFEKGEKKGRKEGKIEGRKEGEIKGRKEGRKEGEIKGRKEGEIKGRKEGRKEGEIKGRKEGKKDIARNMLIENESMEKIMQYTGLNEKEVLDLKTILN